MTARLTVLLALAALGMLFAFSRLSVSFDLAFFVPAPSDFAEEVLTDRVGAGPGVQLVLVDIGGLEPAVIEDLATALRASEHFDVIGDDAAFGIEALPPALWSHRLLLADLPSTTLGWSEVFDARLADLGFLGDPDALELIAADPALTAFAALESLSIGEPPEHLILLNSRSPVFDLDAQQQAINELRATLARLDLGRERAFGSPVYAVDVQTTIQAESVQLTVLASLALLSLLAWRLRSARAVLASAVPLLAGAASAVVALALTYESVHGITLAFGFTLLGVAIDFPLHLLSVARDEGIGGRALAAHIWPTLLIGITSTLVGYLAFVLSGSPGIIQLGVMALAGITGSAAASAWIGLAIEPEPRQRTSQAEPPELRHWGYLAVLVIAGSGLLTTGRFNDDLADLTPIPTEVIKRDAAARAELGGDDLSRLIALKSETVDDVLTQTESLREALTDAVARGELDGFRLATDLLPSTAQQQRRLSDLARLNANPEPINEALAASPLDRGAFAPFFDALQAAADGKDRLTLDELRADSALSSALDALLYQRPDGWVSLVPVIGVSAQPELPSYATWVDLRAASKNLIERFRVRLAEILGLALIAISVVLLIATRSPSRTVWVLGCTLAALAVSALATSIAFGGITLFALISLALVAGLSLDYGLFHSKPDGGPASRRAVALCAASSLIVFGMLATADVPILRAIGLTVALGVASAWLISRLSASTPA